jgi:hypothetical protein
MSQFFNCEEEKEHSLVFSTIGPSGLGGRLGAHLCPLLWEGGHPHKPRLTSSRVLAAPPSALLASRVGVAALVRRQLAGQPERGRHRPGRRRRLRLHRLNRRARRAVFTGITDSSLALLLAGSITVLPPMMQAIIFMAATLVFQTIKLTLRALKHIPGLFFP